MTDIGSSSKKTLFGADFLNLGAQGTGSEATAATKSETTQNIFSQSHSDDVSIIQEDTIIQGDVHSGRRIEIYGYIEGSLTAQTVLIHENGRMYGTLKTDNTEVYGDLQGDVFVKHLISIHRTGSVSGNVQYGQLAMETGGNLTAELRNVPPEIAGDLDLTVKKGQSVKITTVDLTAIDPDDDAEDLTYTVSNGKNGFVALTDKPKSEVKNFTQADLENAKVIFVHDGSDTQSASFDVVVADDDGATSGAPHTVRVSVTKS